MAFNSLHMASLLEAVEQRRTCRRFDSTKKIPKDIIERIVKAAQNSPTGVDFQSYDFIIVTNAEIIDSIAKLSHQNIPENFKSIMPTHEFIFYGAPCMVLICPARPERKDCVIYDKGIIADSLCLAAQSLGIASATIGLIQCAPVDKLNELVGLPTMSPPLAVILGYPDKDWVPQPKPITSAVKWIE